MIYHCSGFQMGQRARPRWLRRLGGRRRVVGPAARWPAPGGSGRRSMQQAEPGWVRVELPGLAVGSRMATPPHFILGFLALVRAVVRQQLAHVSSRSASRAPPHLAQARGTRAVLGIRFTTELPSTAAIHIDLQPHRCQATQGPPALPPPAGAGPGSPATLLPVCVVLPCRTHGPVHAHTYLMIPPPASPGPFPPSF